MFDFENEKKNGAARSLSVPLPVPGCGSKRSTIHGTIFHFIIENEEGGSDIFVVEGRANRSSRINR